MRPSLLILFPFQYLLDPLLLLLLICILRIVSVIVKVEAPILIIILVCFLFKVLGDLLLWGGLLGVVMGLLREILLST